MASAPVSDDAAAVAPVRRAATGNHDWFSYTRIRCAVGLTDVELIPERLDETARYRDRIGDRGTAPSTRGTTTNLIPSGARVVRRAGRAVGDGIEGAGDGVVGVGGRPGPPIGEVETSVVDDGIRDPVAILTAGHGQHPRVAHERDAYRTVGFGRRELCRRADRQRGPGGVPVARRSTRRRAPPPPRSRRSPARRRLPPPNPRPRTSAPNPPAWTRPGRDRARPGRAGGRRRNRERKIVLVGQHGHARNTTTSRPPRTAQVSRQARGSRRPDEWHVEGEREHGERPVVDRQRRQIDESGAPWAATGGPANQDHDHDDAHGRLRIAATTVGTVPRPAIRPVVRNDPPTSNVASAQVAATNHNTTVTGTNTAETATTSDNSAETPAVRGVGAIPSTTSSSAREGSAVSMPTERRSRWTAHGNAAYQARADQLPVASKPGTSGVAAYTTMVAMRPRLEGNTVARRHAPATPSTNIPMTAWSWRDPSGMRRAAETGQREPPRRHRRSDTERPSNAERYARGRMRCRGSAGTHPPRGHRGR